MTDKEDDAAKWDFDQVEWDYAFSPLSPSVVRGTSEPTPDGTWIRLWNALQKFTAESGNTK